MDKCGPAPNLSLECADMMVESMREQTLSKVACARITVVTVVFNGENEIENTIKSVLSQDYPNIEYIIIDGGSVDRTLDIIRKYQSKVDYWKSEADLGIYDAMNKAISLATGRWINFMNAGDEFYSSSTVSDVFLNEPDGVGVVYGGVEILYADFSRTELPGWPRRLWSGMQYCHQSAFVRTDYHKTHKFNSVNKIAADLHFFYKAYRDGVQFKRENKIISRVITGGLSESNRIRTIRDSCSAICGGDFRPIIRLYFFAKMMDSLLRTGLKNLLPQVVVKNIIKSKSQRSKCE